jgi:4-amino-4-deoxy-L-arabinose transferase-like glycosyltransferase
MKHRSNIALALVLVAIGSWFLAIEISPALKDLAYGENFWPVPIIGIGVLLALIGLLTWTPGFFIPACIVGGIGGLLYWQNLTDNWESWTYAWALIPIFVGTGTILSGVFSRGRGAVVGGFWTIFNGLVLFAIFAAIFGGGEWARLWPVLVIALGVILLVQAIFRRR